MPRIVLLGGDTDYNVGDKAIVAALASQLAVLVRDLRLSIVGRPVSRSELPAVIDRVIPRGAGGFVELLAEAHRSDGVCVAGGGLFQDDDSRVKMPYWAVRLSLLRAANPNLAGHAIGAGPLAHVESRAAARIACANLRSVSVRDGFARRWLAPCTGHVVPVVPDPAFMLPAASSMRAAEWLRERGLRPGQPIVGMALRRWFHRRGGFVPHRVRHVLRLDREAGAAEFGTLLEDVAAAVRPLLKQLDAALLLLPTYDVGHEGDGAACARIAALLPDVPVHLGRIEDPALYKAVAGRLALMVSARMHPLILAAGMGVPLVGLAYNGKFEGLFELLGIPGRFLWLEDFRDGGQAGRLRDLLMSALADGDAIGRRADALAERSREATRALLDELGVAA